MEGDTPSPNPITGLNRAGWYSDLARGALSRLGFFAGRRLLY